MSYIPVRLSHLLRHSSVGAIVRGPEYLMAIKDTREWSQQGGKPSGRVIPHVEQVMSALSIPECHPAVKELREPPISRIVGGNRVDGVWIPALRFPFWTQCPSCHLLYYKPWKPDEADEMPECSQCKKRSKLEQVPWVLIHKDGHMADLPWRSLAHRNRSSHDQNQCRDHSRIYLKSGTGKKRELYCKSCGATGGFNMHEELEFGKMRRQPWLKEPPEKESEGKGEVVEINDVRVHSPMTRSALVIPPESRIDKGACAYRLNSGSDLLENIENARPGPKRDRAIAHAAWKLGCSKEDIESALIDISKGYPLYGETITHGELFPMEYKALIEPIADLQESEDFVTSHRTDEWQNLADGLSHDSKAKRFLDFIDNVVEVRRLKEIMVMRGFYRMGENDGPPVPPDIVGESDWLPALELYGEGVFFTIRESLIQQWETQTDITEKAKIFANRYETSGQDFDPGITVDPRFLLLHTISHLLIREMETEAGYPAASLKERIYSSRFGECPMAGVLVYVAVPDVAGSLGGLEELAEPSRLLKLITRVFERAQWCSLDPVCSTHEGQGPNLLNHAACHACALIPETSCSYGNMLLDRFFIKSFEREGLKPIADTMVGQANG